MCKGNNQARVCIPLSTSSIKCRHKRSDPCSLKRNAFFAEQRRARHSYRGSISGPTSGGACTTLSVNLAVYHQRPVGSKCRERLHNQIPAKACAVQKTPSVYLHRGGGMHAGRDAEHVGQRLSFQWLHSNLLHDSGFVVGYGVQLTCQVLDFEEDAPLQAPYP